MTKTAKGVYFNADGRAIQTMDPGAKIGILQALCTRNFGEVISADAY